MNPFELFLSKERHARLSEAEVRAFLPFADPLAPAQSLPTLDSRGMERLTELATRHRFLPIAARNMAKAGLPLPPDLARRHHEERVRTLGVTLLLNDRGDRLTRAFSSAGLRTATVKGPVFARLYPTPTDRVFNDIDILVSPDHLRRVEEVLTDLGLAPAIKAHFDNSVRDQEYQWFPTSPPLYLLEIHQNLVHNPRLRALAPFGFEELSRAGGGDPHAPSASLATAVVHAAHGHKFVSLSFLIDILQTFRALPDADKDAAARAARELRIDFDMAFALRLVGEVFGEAEATVFAREIRDDEITRAAERTITAYDVANSWARGSLDSWIARRRFRAAQIRAASR